MFATCPSQEKLKSLSLGQLPEEQSDVLLQHLGSCETCQETISGIDEGEDTFIRQIKSAGTEDADEFESEKGCQVAATRALAALALAEDGINKSGIPNVPSSIGEYDIVEPLGQGGMGHVYLGRHTKLGRPVAIKFIADHRRWDQTMHQRFASEMRLIGGLKHPNIVIAHDAREVDGLAVLVTEYIDGMTLSEILKRTGKLEKADACKIVGEVCKALTYIDSKGLVHRDIKPSNIMIDADGSVKLLDLGLARLQATDETADYTATGQAMGTADYVAPEQINDSRNVDIRSDVYGLGCTFYKLLSGRAPFAGKHSTAFAKMSAHVSETPDSLAGDVPSVLVKLVDKMLEKDPANRPQSPDDVLLQIEKHTGDSDLANLIATARSMPVRESSLPLKNATTSEPKLEGSSFRKYLWGAVIAGCLAAFALGTLLGVKITVKKPDGTTVQLDIPDGAIAIVDGQGNVEIQLPGTDQSSTIPRERVQGAGAAGRAERLAMSQQREQYKEDLRSTRPSDVTPYRNPQTAVMEGARLLEAGNCDAFLKAFVPPARLTEITKKRSFDEYVIRFRDRKAEPLHRILEAAKDVEPTIDTDGNTAVFKLREEVNGKNEIAFKKIGLRWYIDSSPPQSLSLGSVAPSFTVETTTGRKIQSDQLRGKLVVLHFWATWCGPCIRQMPDHIRSLEQHPSKNIEIIFICMDDKKDDMTSTIDQFNIPFNNVAGPDGWADFGVALLPTDVVIDPNGRIASNTIDDVETLLAQFNGDVHGDHGDVHDAHGDAHEDHGDAHEDHGGYDQGHGHDDQGQIPVPHGNRRSEDKPHFDDAGGNAEWQDEHLGEILSETETLPNIHLLGEDVNMDNIVATLAGKRWGTVTLADAQFSSPLMASLSQATSIKSLRLYGEDLSGHIPRLRRVNGLSQLHLGGSNLRLRDFEALAKLQQLRSLTLPQETTLSILAAKELAKLTNLESLSLRGTEMDDASFQQLETLVNLQYLDIAQTRITDAGIQTIEKMPELRELNLLRYESQVPQQLTDKAANSIGELTKLESLTLSGSISATGLAKIGELPNLTYLVIAFTSVSGDDLKALMDSDIEHLSVSPGQLNEMGLRHLKKMMNLRSITVHGQPTGRNAEWERQLPNLQFNYHS